MRDMALPAVAHRFPSVWCKFWRNRVIGLCCTLVVSRNMFSIAIMKARHDSVRCCGWRRFVACLIHVRVSHDRVFAFLTVCAQGSLFRFHCHVRLVRYVTEVPVAGRKAEFRFLGRKFLFNVVLWPDWRDRRGFYAVETGNWGATSKCNLRHLRFHEGLFSGRDSFSPFVDCSQT